jgi:hypothetical protein
MTLAPKRLLTFSNTTSGLPKLSLPRAIVSPTPRT